MNLVPEIEGRSPESIREFQLHRVQEMLTYVGSHSPFYKRIFSSHGINARDISTWKDFQQLPVTTKDDLQEHNWDFLCVPRSKVVEYTSTSGTLGKPVTIALTEKDLQRLAYNEAISFTCAEGQKSDLYQLMLTLDRQFMAGIAYYEGIRKMGAGLIRIGPGLPALQWETIERLKPTALVAVPSFMIKLIEFAQQKGLSLNNSSIRKAVCIGEGLRTSGFALNAMGTRIRESWDIDLFSTYASTEMQTAFTECREGRGGHLHPELIYVELLDDEGKHVPQGSPGEVTITTLGIEGMPLLRYRTGDIAHIHPDPCPCGRNTERLGPIVGRKQQMIKLKGTTLYPPALFDILQQEEQVREYVVEVFTGPLGTDELKLHVAIADGHASTVEQSLQRAFQSRIRVVPEISILSNGEIEALQHAGGARKIKRFIDNRS